MSPSLRLAELNPPVKIDGDVLSFNDYPYIPKIIDDIHPHIVIIKGAQLGGTAAMILKVIMRMAQESLRGSIYLFPREIDAIQFSKARFRRILNENAALSNLVKETDSAQIRRIHSGFAYFRGAASVPALKSVPADLLVFDELDEMEEDKVELARHRLDGSKLPSQCELSTATFPDYGVDLAYKASDGNVWMIQCDNCKEWTCLELAWPDVFQTDPHTREIYRACRKCKKPIHSADGEWVARFPDRTAPAGDTIEDLKRAPGKRGYWISQLNSPRRQPHQILQEFKDAEHRGKLREFYNSVLGIAFAEASDSLTKEIILAACDQDEPRRPSSVGPTAMGFDCGANDFHFAVAEKRSGDREQIIEFGRVTSEDEIINVIDRYNVSMAVADEMAETRTVRRIKARRPGKVYGCWYVGEKKGGYDWDAKAATITVGRTESLDESHQRILRGQTRFPKPDDLMHKIFIPQLCNLVRVTRPVNRADGRDSGRMKSLWIIRGTKNDHMRHAVNYLGLALARVPAILPGKRRGSGSGSGRKRPRGWMTA
jgi:hypothetical protein